MPAVESYIREHTYRELQIFIAESNGSANACFHILRHMENIVKTNPKTGTVLNELIELCREAMNVDLETVKMWEDELDKRDSEEFERRKNDE